VEKPDVATAQKFGRRIFLEQRHFFRARPLAAVAK
jgi:hypothetical protein